VEWLTIQFPDPWTKKKHFKRRLVDPQFVADCARLISDARGKVYLCSDRYDLACFMYDTFAASELWVVVPELADAHSSTTAEAVGMTEGKLASSNDDVEDAGDEEEAAGEEGEAEEWGKEVYREKDADDARCWLARRPFPVGTERDSVAEKKNRPVHRAVFQRVIA
jgi:tRNA G46 methylase TrmB